MGESKQVKVDNWGIFFLQRLQTFFNKTYFCDLTLQFEDNVQLKVHRLVMNACTEYFQVLEQTCEVINDCLIMPPDLQADVVVPIVNFMYTGILEFQASIFDRLYTTARLMNMTVLTKLLDAQKVPISPMPKPLNKRSPISPITWNLQGKKISPKTMDPDLPEPLPGRKLPIWKRKSVPGAIAYRNDLITALPDPLSSKYFRSSIDEAPKPTRFEWPEDDETNFDTSSFDEISYTSKPIMIPQREKSPKPSTSSNNFEELKRSSVAVKRPASPIYSDSKKVNIQDVKEYMKEQKLRSDYIDYDDSEAADNDLQTYENDNDTDEDNNKEDIFEQNEDTPNKSILKNDTSASHNKRVRFSLEGKENAAKTLQKTATATVKSNANAANVDLTNHTKIITEVLKKYPHLVKKNKNIRLKILAKGANTQSAGLKPMGNPLKLVKPAVKVNYMVMKPGESAVKTVTPDKKDGHWSCHKCSNPNPLLFETYYLYRKHLTDVHNEKTDSQMCNICGHISRKQNLLMYHKFVKHEITPPPSYQFPKCKECSYVALSAGMLNKHQLTHTHQNLACAECNTAFQNKSALISHVQLTGHTDKNNCPTYDCTYCTKKFISDETLFQHIKNNHKIEATRDNIISQLEEEPQERKEYIITAEEIDALEEKSENQQEIVTQEFVQQEIVAQEFVQQEIVSQEFVQQEIVQQEIVQEEILQQEVQEKPKEKIKILSDVKVKTLKNTKLQPVKLVASQETETTSAVESQPLEPSSEAESLSNVASGIAASLGLVNTIVVLDDNQFILQSRDGNQENPQNIILPENINNIQNLVSQHQVITTDANAIISQATLGKNNITSTDELVMVLTDHDYSDAANNAVITSESSNIVVLYSHPVQTQDGQYMPQSGNLMLNSEMGLVEVGNNYSVNAVEEKCEESIELIQQEINNQLDNENHEIAQNNHKVVEEEIIAQEIEHDTKEITEPTEEKMEVDVDQHLIDQQVQDQQVQDQQVQDQHVQDQKIQELEVIEFMQENQTVQEEFENQVPSQETETTVSETPSEEIQTVHETHDDNNYEEPMEIEESIQLNQEIHQKNQETHQNSTDIQEMQENSNLQKLQKSSVDLQEMKENSVNLQEIQENSANLQEIRGSSVNLQEITAEENLKTVSEDVAPNRSEKIQEEINLQKELEVIPEETEALHEEKEQEHIEAAETTEDKTNESQVITEQEVINKHQEEEIEHMEVDSAKFVENTENLQNEILNIVPSNQENNVTAPEEITEDRSQNTEDLHIPQELQEEENILIPLENQEITPVNKDINSEHEENTQQENIEKEIDNTTEETIVEPETISHEINEEQEIKAPLEEETVDDHDESTEEHSKTNEEFNETTKGLNETTEDHTKNFDDPNEIAEKLNKTSDDLNETTEDLNETVEDINETVEDISETVEDISETISEEQEMEMSEEIQIQENKTSEELVSSFVETTDKLEETKALSIRPSTINNTKLSAITNSRISNLLDDWDDGDTDSQQSDNPKSQTDNSKTQTDNLKPQTDNRSSINTLINDWEDDEES